MPAQSAAGYRVSADIRVWPEILIEFGAWRVRSARTGGSSVGLVCVVALKRCASVSGWADQFGVG